MTKEELLEEAKRRYPVGTRFIPAHLGDIDDYCIITDDTVLQLMYDNVVATVNGQAWLPKEEHHPKYGSEHNYNRNVYSDGRWAKIVGSLSHQDLLNEAYCRYPVGTRYTTAAGDSPDTYTVIEQSFRLNIRDHGVVQVYGESGKGCLYHDGKWANIVYDLSKLKPKPKYKLGDEVKVCQPHKCNGFGYYNESDGCYDAVNGVGNNIGKINAMMYSSSKNEWYYHLDCHYRTGYIAEHALSLLHRESKYKVGDEVWLSVQHHGVPPRWVTISEVLKDGYYLDGWAGHFPEYILSLTEQPVEKEPERDMEAFKEVVQSKYSVGTQFIALNSDGEPHTAYAPFTVQDDWILRNTSDGENYWYVNSHGSTVHEGLVYTKGKWAEIITPKSPDKKVIVLTSFKSLPFTRI